MLHQSLCSATGIPHSTQMRTRWVGWDLRENSLLRIDIVRLRLGRTGGDRSPSPTNRHLGHETEKPPPRFAKSCRWLGSDPISEGRGPIFSARALANHDGLGSGSWGLTPTRP